MVLENYLKTLDYPLSQRTLCYLLQQDRVLLGRKKKGFGFNYYLGFGGKVEKGESILDAAIREVYEESCLILSPSSVHKVAVLNFYFPYLEEKQQPFWNQQVHVYLGKVWKGEPQETVEMIPNWFSLNKIPYENMWDDAKYWLKDVLTGENLIGNFLFTKDLKVEEHRIIKGKI
ncbi:hypothetical protein A2X44_01125 [candidate division CPR3 bacterium GWF2_35_18]|uniref:Oxidized purine nucleoside triphosphate hydrolase n=1 Tax=candidate division CPR3 bacterium GW2011_GWF2_35_18 TaxID=1618350 RepID=A0A0G0BLB8_UNCC3|nr:MAG: NUDIX hydrolase [candidate division CPR3 bacterium GW2011_GWF2_35_18]KKP85551.1 MAG: NUDIX hydrolase [candidate division CPR3 bacterium GW2011_GWE2_35_7]OGB63504.1 MAG: hypothetical protein A2X44_01125 [candidate division CPR3 bacterium GWF2_35_18]OGB64751.1 MAG: hypothetical protein A2250_04900 [candidate division CPR3 bacterium RIFOXYA2_FULL_35_13]OGB77380.1 MAG: hypothetical protein A2476_05805 [candidate division CPR3 bacterium RIFOXYC2_FULL_35_7]OGB78473.1 MAG: hypothetical protei